MIRIDKPEIPVQWQCNHCIAIATVDVVRHRCCHRRHRQTVAAKTVAMLALLKLKLRIRTMN